MNRFKKKLLSSIIAFIFILITIIPNISVYASTLSDDALLDLESKGCFEFFLKEANTDPSSPGYGLIRDRALDDKNQNTTSPNTSTYNSCSVASVGFGLSAVVIGTERGWISRDAAYERELGTLNTLLNNADNVNGFFYHFLNIGTAKRLNGSEASIIDTAIAINGAITAGEYFGGEIKDKAQELYDRVDWTWYKDTKSNQFYMGYTPEKGFTGHWDFYAEQLMLYILGAGSSTHPINPDMFYSFTRHYSSYGNYPKFINSWFGSIFTYQYSYSWIDFRNKLDSKGVNWWANSIIASKSSRQFAIDESSKYKTFGENSWGLTASDGPNGYEGRYGSIPSGTSNDQNFVDGTLAPSGALGSIAFTPKESIAALRNYYENYPNLWGKYGLKDAYNVDKNWYDSDVIGIDKGVTLLMIENYRSNLIWKCNMKNKNIQTGMQKVGLKNIGTSIFDDFEGNTLNTGWVDGGDKCYNLNVTKDNPCTGTHSLKVEYNKANFPWSFMKTTLKNASLDGDNLTAMVYNSSNSPLKLLLKIETTAGSHEHSFTITDTSKWEQISWDISAFRNDLTNVKDVLIFAAPGEENSTGKFYIDDISIQTKVNASNVYIDGNSIVGETLHGSYDYYDSNNIAEGKSKYEWLRADSIDGEYNPIDGAVSKTYTITNNDVGKFLKFQVTPVNANNYSGFAVQSSPTASADVPVPVAQNVTITKAPVDKVFVIDDFSSDTLKNNWADSGDKCYNLSINKTMSPDKSGCLKVDYDKKTDWGFFYYKFDKITDLSNSNLMSFDACGNAKFIVKFEDDKGNGVKENTFTVNSSEFKQFTWDISGFNNLLGKVNRILIFAAPGNSGVNGTFYLKNFETRSRTITDVTKEGGVPNVGETLYANYTYHDSKGDKEDGTTFKWLRSEKADGMYTEIPGAKGSSYTLTKDDLAKYIKLEVTPKTSGGRISGDSALSSPSNQVYGTLISNIALNKNTDTLSVGDSDMLNAVVSPSDAVKKDLIWSSDNPKVVSVDSNGKITALSEGAANITASASDGSGKSAVCNVTVKPKVSNSNITGNSQSSKISGCLPKTGGISSLDLIVIGFILLSSGTILVLKKRHIE